MDISTLLVGVVLPYVAVAVFVAGMAYRLFTWKKMASPPMTLFPSPPDTSSNTIQEVILFKSLFKGDRVLWIFAWLFHAVLLLIFLGHFRVLTGLIDEMLLVMGMNEQGIKALSGGAGGAAGVLILAALLLLLIRRLMVPRVREVTAAADYLALILLGAIISSGNMMRFGDAAEAVTVAITDAEVPTAHSASALLDHAADGHFDLGVTRDYFRALATFSFSDPTPINDALAHRVFVVHMCLAFVLFMLIPFSKILHLGGIFFTHQLIRKP